MSVQDLKSSPMMSHLLEALDAHKDIGHYGRLVFTIVGQYFMSDEELYKYLQKNPGVSAEDARALVQEVKAQGYNPPSRDTVLDWQKQQDFPICPEENDSDACNVYKNLKFPDKVYQNIQQYHVQKAQS